MRCATLQLTMAKSTLSEYLKFIYSRMTGFRILQRLVHDPSFQCFRHVLLRHLRDTQPLVIAIITPRKTLGEGCPRRECRKRLGAELPASPFTLRLSHHGRSIDRNWCPLVSRIVLLDPSKQLVGRYRDVADANGPVFRRFELFQDSHHSSCYGRHPGRGEGGISTIVNVDCPSYEVPEYDHIQSVFKQETVVDICVGKAAALGQLLDVLLRLDFGAVRGESSNLGVLKVRPELGWYEAFHSGRNRGIYEFELAFQPSSLAKGRDNGINALEGGPQ